MVHAGCGFFAKRDQKTLNSAALPNLEDPDNLVESWDDHPEPVGFGFYGRAWVTEEVDLNLDTLCLIPDEKRFYLVWRGLCPINDLTALEVSTVEVAEV